MKIWTDDECIEVDPNDVGKLEAAMLFKAEHIKAKADPELFYAVADALEKSAPEQEETVCHCNVKENAELIAKILDADLDGEIYKCCETCGNYFSENAADTCVEDGDE